ncbi:MAG: glycosyltransferase [Planctomycetaceae bacterium]|nr:glycosyltransferase [Planctomycetaceae bacterium]
MIQAIPHENSSGNSADLSTQFGRPTVCQVIHALGVGGAEVLVDQMVRLMSDEFRFVIAVLDDVGEIGQRLKDDGFIVHELHRQPGIDRGCAKRLRAFADQQRAGILHSHQCTPFFQSMLSRGLTGRRPVLLTEHGRHFPDLPSRKRSLVNRLLLRREDRIVGCGGAVAQALVSNEGLPEGRIEVIYNGVDLKSLRTASSDARQRVRAEFGYSDSDFVVVQIARLHELKDHQTALRAIDEARLLCPQIRLLIAGDGDCRGAIEQTIQQRGLENHVCLAGTRSDIADLLAAADVGLLTSISEGIPLTVIEAMAAHRPVVATAVGGIPEMIIDGHNGLLAPSGDASALAGHLLHLQQSPETSRLMGEAGAAVAQSRFSLQGMIQSYREVYREMLTGNGCQLKRQPEVSVGSLSSIVAECSRSAELSGAVPERGLVR